MKIAICDDDPKDLKQLHTMVNRYDSSLGVSVFYDAVSLLQACQNDSFDLLFLDIEMELLDGFTAAQILTARNQKPLVVFCSNSSEYTIRGYGIAFRYLLKPITYDAFAEVLGQAMEKLTPQKLMLLSGGKTFVLPISEIICVEVQNHTIILDTASRTYEIRGKLKDIEQQLPTASFAKPHNSYIVNLAEINSMTAKQITMRNGKTIPISQRYRKAIQAALFQYVRS